MSDSHEDHGTPVGIGSSRARQQRQAVRRPLMARISLAAPSGAGKTWTALQIADVLADGMPGPIVVIDTEATTEEMASSETYADSFRFDVINWQREWNYDPRDLVATFNDFGRLPIGERPAVVIIDSATHYWHGPGGVLDISSGRFTGWKVAREVQRAFIEAILTAPFHVILCMRAKTQHAVEESGGKQTVTKLGLGAMQDDTIEFEMQVALMIDMNHRLDVSKTRSNVMAGRSWEANHEREMAQLFKSWLAKGEDVIRKSDVDALISAFLACPDADRAAVRAEFKSAFGSPTFMAPDQLDAAWQFLFAAIPVEPHPFEAVDPEDPLQADRCKHCKGGRSACRWHRAAPIETDTSAQIAPAASDDAESTVTAHDDPSPGGAQPGAPGEQPSDVVEGETPDENPEAGYGPADDQPIDPDVDPDVDPDEPTEIVVSRGTTASDETLDEATDRLAIERRIFAEVKDMDLAVIKQDLARRHLPVTGNAQTIRARFARLLCMAETGVDPFSQQ